MKHRAFTLIELLVVISIIALLASVVLSSLSAARDKGRLASAKQFSANVYHAAADSAAAIYEFNECSGTTPTADRSGNNFNATLNGTPTYQTDTALGVGCSLLFNGTTQYLSAGNVQGNIVPFTWSAWIKTTQVASHASIWGHPAIMGLIQGSGATNDAQLMVNNGYLTWYDELNGGGVSFAGPFVSDGVWHQVAVSRSGTSLRFFVDGKQVGTATTGSNPLNTNGMEIARALYSNSMYFAGYIDQVYIFSKDLTASEVGKLYAEGAKKYLALE